MHTHRSVMMDSKVVITTQGKDLQDTHLSPVYSKSKQNISNHRKGIEAKTKNTITPSIAHSHLSIACSSGHSTPQKRSRASGGAEGDSHCHQRLGRARLQMGDLVD